MTSSQRHKIRKRRRMNLERERRLEKRILVAFRLLEQWCRQVFGETFVDGIKEAFVAFREVCVQIADRFRECFRQQWIKPVLEENALETQ